jgi:hypothetical protein
MPDETLVEYEMGYAADEFGNVLNGPFSGDKSSYRCNEIELPVLEVKFSFTDTDAVLRNQFFHRFHQYFHKGGG